MEQSNLTFTSAWDLLNERSKTVQTIITFCEKLDNALGGGVQLGHVTELAGPASIGKTQICLQLAVDVQLPKLFAGVEGSAIYVDTECCYKPKRVEEIAKAAVQHCNDVANSSDLVLAAEAFTLESILNGIYVKRCWDMASLATTIEEMEPFIRLHPKVKLVIIDSFAFHFRDDQCPERDRRRLLLKSVSLLAKLASDHNIAVLAVNQMTTRPTESDDAFEEPALNEILTQNAGDQIILGWRKRKQSSSEDVLDVDRCAVLYKSARRGRSLVPFQICTDGVRDL